MFFPLFLLTTVILSLISVQSLSQLDDHENTTKLMSSTAVFYAAESSLEESLYQFKTNKESSETQKNSLIRAFDLEKIDMSQNTGELVSSDYEIDIVERSFDDAPKSLVEEQTKKAFDEFRLMNIQTDNLFTELQFFFQEKNIPFSGGVVLDIIAMPRTYFESDTGFDTYQSNAMNFGSVRDLSTKTGDINRNVKRMMFYSEKPEGQRVQNAFDGIEVTLGSALDNSKYEQVIKINYLNPSSTNYIIRFSTPKKEEILYEMMAVNVNETRSVSNQILEVDAQTAVNNMYQRVKQQQRSFAPLQPELNFVLFSDEAISK